MIRMLNYDDDQCQAIKTNVKEKYQVLQKNNRDFLGECTDFVKNIIDLHDSPWSTCDFVRWARTKYKVRLGRNQCTLLRFLQYRYFRKGQPCFVKQSFIADVLNIDRTQINRMLKSLEQKKLIIRIQWLFKGRRKNSVVLPLIPSLLNLFDTQNLPDADFQKCHNQCDILFCKPLKSERFSKPFLYYTNLIYINKLFNNNKVNVNSLLLNNETFFKQCGQEAAHSDKLCLVESKCEPLDNESTKGESMLDKFMLKRKKHSLNHAYQGTFDALKSKFDYDIDKLPALDRNELLTYIQHFHGIDINSHFKIPQRQSSKTAFYREQALEIRKYLIRLIVDGNDLQWAYADQIMERWNGICKIDKRMKRINTKTKDTKTYLNAVIILSHCLIYMAKGNLTKMLTAIDRVPLAHNLNKPPFTWRGEIRVDKFFMNDSSFINVKFISAYLNTQEEFERWLYFKKTLSRHNERVKNGYGPFVEKYVDIFYGENGNRQVGFDQCYRFEYMIKNWLEKRIIEIVDSNRKMYDYSLVFDKEESGTGQFLPSLVDQFFFYIKTNYNRVLMNDLLSNEKWNEFIVNYMQTIVGINDFYELDHYQRKGKAS